MDKKALSERDICTKFITPAVTKAGWDVDTQILEEKSFTKGRIMVRGKLVSRGALKRADYILSYKPNIPLAVIEAKDNSRSVGDGMQQALDYAETLGIPFVFSSNGDGFVFHDRTGNAQPVEVDLPLDAFPSPADLWERYRQWKGLTREAEQIILQPYYGGKGPRYYQVNAINAAVEAIAKGQQRILLVMATGTGKTYTAFQIIWRLWKAGRERRILFLANRNVLIDQTMVNDFRPFGGVMAKLSTRSKTIEKADGTKEELALAVDGTRQVDKSHEVYLGLYQSLTGPEERQKLYKSFSPGFFDLIVIDECHRGSAAEDSAWREILEYFDSATQIGLTATPKETTYTSNIAYFGKPVFSYTLKQGIRDGFLAPCKVVKVPIDPDVEGYRPEKGQLDRDGDEVDDPIDNARDFERTLVLDDRTRLVARKVTEFLKQSGDRFQKTIVFCVDQEHAARMRQALVNENADLVQANARYVMRITGNDKEGTDQLGNFIDPESTYPVLVTTSRLLSTGVDAQTCRLIVLDREVGSMTEFKQIVGRGTRVHEDTKKFFFTLIDFRGATNHFADPDFDGEPVQIYEPGPDESPVPPDDVPPSSDDEDPIPPQPGDDETIVDGFPFPSASKGGFSDRRKVCVDGVTATIVAERVEYLDENGKLITETLRDFTKTKLKKRFTSLDDFLKRWKAAERKQAVIDELAAEGLLLDPIAEEVGKDLDPFDLICHVAFDRKPLTRRDRADNVKKRDVFAKYGPQARAVLDALLAKYADEGVLNLDDTNVLRIAPFTGLGTPFQLIRAFGDRQGFEQAVREMQAELYQETTQPMHDDFLPGVSAAHVLARLAKAGGAEIESGKFASPESSAALACNTFGWFAERPGELPPLPGMKPHGTASLVDVEYSARFPFRGGKHPWLDAVVETGDQLIGVESKRFEPYRDRKKPIFSAAYSRVDWGADMKPYEAMRDALASGQQTFEFLDAAQLVKHAFGLVTDGRRKGKAPVLVYLFAEPASLKGSPIPAASFARHREEIARFAAAVREAEVSFQSISYREWLAMWPASPSPVGDHARAIVERFHP